MSEVVELIYGRNEAESFENSKKLEEWILAGQESSWQSRESLHFCHPAHEGSFLQHTVVTPVPCREDESGEGEHLFSGEALRSQRGSWSISCGASHGSWAVWVRALGQDGFGLC